MAGTNGFRMLERFCATAITGAAIPFSFGVMATIACACKGGNYLDVWGAAVVFAVIGAIPGAAAGAVGGVLGRCGRAGAFGTFMFLAAACEYLWLDGWKTWATIANLVVLSSFVGAFAGGAGAVVGRTFGDPSAGVRRARLSMLESVAAACLGLILLVYIFLTV
jgi:hypothetical protein